MTVFLSLIFLFAMAEDMPKADLTFSNGKKLEIEVASTFSNRYQGLMKRQSLPENSGMLFIFDAPQKLNFWMKNTYIPLSIAYLDKNKVIKEIYQMKAQSMMEREQDLSGYPSRCSCQYALEVNQGWFKKNKVKVGQTISFKLKASK